ncbi:DUF5667 domain-containing protein [Microbispora sp. NPDC049125]|uniref:DUF5667 domain-containing protein n=1 Tax=Microbispora sp. NPDC049125 TaxID=3154929 RepID=UPI003465D5E3
MGWWRFSRWSCRRWVARASETVADLRSLLGSGPSPQFRADLRAELLRTHAAERAAAPASEPPPARRPAIRRRSLLAQLRPLLVFAVLMVAMFGTGVQTFYSVPGDALYPLKRAAEATVLSLAYDDRERAQREMAAAHERAAETRSLLGGATPDRHRLIGQTLDDMEMTTRAALGRVSPRERATRETRSFVREQRTLVEPMLKDLDEENRDKATKYLRYIDTFTVSGR